MTERIRMRRYLSELHPVFEAAVPLAESADTELAELMLNAYRGTVDDEGEDYQDALTEIRETLGGKYGPVIPEASFGIAEDGVLVSAIITIINCEAPFISYVFTDPSCQRRGFAAALIETACARLAADGWDYVELGVTVGSQGESLYRRMGLVVVDGTEVSGS